MHQEKMIECFVPALALEHPSNPETFKKVDKVRAAVRRYEQNGDFDSLITVRDPMPDIFIKKMEFKPEALGYWVVAKFSL